MKGIRFEGLRVVGRPHELAKRYAEQEADEILYIDTVASLYGRNQLEGLLEQTVEDVFIPITVGGGIKSIQDADRLFRAGADKVAINTAGLSTPDLLNSIADRYGNQALVVSIEAKRSGDSWEAYCDNGRERTGKDAVAWAFEAVSRGAGELLVTSVDQDGTKAGCDLDLYKRLTKELPIPVVAAGGIGTLDHAREAIAVADAIAVGTALHYNLLTINEIRANSGRP